MKKLISAALCFVLAIVSVISVSAESRVTGKNRTYKYVTKYTINNGQAGFFTSNITDTNAYIELRNISSGKITSVYFSDLIYHPTYLSMGSYNYEQTRFIGSGGSGGGGNLNFSNTGGKYERIKIKLSDYISGFNSDGTVTKDGHKYNFKKQVEGNTTYESSLIFESGGAFTLAAPDKNGMVEIVVSTKIGQEVRYSTNFSKHTLADGRLTSSSGGGINRGYFCGLTYGDCDDSCDVDITDATTIQQNIAHMNNFDDAQVRSGDMNKDGKIDISDATMIQQYIAGISLN